jgi:hypothetical protein
MRLGWLGLGLLVAALACPLAANASSDYVSVLTGIGQGNLKAPQLDYRDQHIVVAFGHNIKPYLERHLNLTPPGDWDFRWEPFYSNISSPGHNLEVGCMASLRIGIPLHGRWEPYIGGGSGPIYTTQHTLEQSTQFNIVSYAAAGIEYRINEHHAISLEGWTRHYSNGSVKNPNDGIDTRDWMLGYTIYK